MDVDTLRDPLAERCVCPTQPWPRWWSAAPWPHVCWCDRAPWCCWTRRCSTGRRPTGPGRPPPDATPLRPSLLLRSGLGRGGAKWEGRKTVQCWNINRQKEKEKMSSQCWQSCVLVRDNGQEWFQIMKTHIIIIQHSCMTNSNFRQGYLYLHAVSIPIKKHYGTTIVATV